MEVERTALEWKQKHFRPQRQTGSYLTFILQEEGSGAQFSSLTKRPCTNQRIGVSLKGVYKEDLLWGDPIKRESIPHISVVSAQQRPGEQKRRKHYCSLTVMLSPQHPGPTLSRDGLLVLASSLQAVSPAVCGRLYLPVLSGDSHGRNVPDERQITAVRRKREEASKPRYILSCREGYILLGWIHFTMVVPPRTLSPNPAHTGGLEYMDVQITHLERSGFFFHLGSSANLYSG